MAPKTFRGEVGFVLASVGFTLGLIFLTAVPATQTYWALTFLSLLIIPFDMDMSFPATTVITSNALPRHN